MVKQDSARSRFKFLSLIFIICFILSLGVYSSILYSEKGKVDAFLDRHNITGIPIFAPTRDGEHISCVLYMDSNMIDRIDRSVPSIIFVPGADNPKSNLFNIKFQFIKFGYSVIAMEQRGHGESGGYFTLYEKECFDISDVINYLSDNFPQLNTSHIGLVGMSLGGGAAVGAQALDDRIHASVIYHPAANLSDLFRLTGFHPFDYVGFLPGMGQPKDLPMGIPNWDQIKEEYWSEAHDTINLVNETNTKNLLLLHGSNDDMIRPAVSQAIHDKADPNNTREDVQVVIRPNLGHGDNEKNFGSLRYTLTWFNHFYKNGSINLSDIDSEINTIQFYEFDFPNTGNYKSWITISVLSLIAYLYSAIFGILFPQQIKISKSQLVGAWHGSSDPEMKKKYTRTFIIRSITLISIYIGCSAYARMRNPSILNAFLVHPVFIAIPLLLFIPLGAYPKDSWKQEYVRNLREDIKKWVNKDSIRAFLFSYCIFGIPILLYLGLLNLGGIYTIDGIYNPGFSIGFTNILTFGIIFAIPFLLLRDLPGQYSFLLIPVVFLGILFGTLILPIKPISIIPISQLGIVLAIALAMVQFMVYLVLLSVRKLLTRNNFATLLILGTLIAIPLWIRLMRIV